MQCTAAASRVLCGSTASPFTGSASLRQAAPRQQQQQRASRQMGGATTAVSAPPQPKLVRPDSTGRYGRFGGKYVPETLIVALEELEAAYNEARADPAFNVSGCLMSEPHMTRMPFPAAAHPPLHTIVIAGGAECGAQGLCGPRLPAVPRRAPVRALPQVGGARGGAGARRCRFGGQPKHTSLMVGHCSTPVTLL